jgi:hypothetical protein
MAICTTRACAVILYLQWAVVLWQVHLCHSLQSCRKRPAEKGSRLPQLPQVGCPALLQETQALLQQPTQEDALRLHQDTFSRGNLKGDRRGMCMMLSGRHQLKVPGTNSKERSNATPLVAGFHSPQWDPQCPPLLLPA